LLRRDRREREPADEVHVADGIEGEVDAEHPAAALEQEPVELGVVLVGLAAEERLDLQAVRVGDQPGHRDQLAGALEPDGERAWLGLRVADSEPVEDLAQQPRRIGDGLAAKLCPARPGAAPLRGSGHASTVAPTSLMASRYTASSRSTVTDQPNPEACFRAP